MSILKRRKLPAWRSTDRYYFKITGLLILSGLLSSCHVGRFFIYNFADVNDYRKFPSLPVENESTTFSFIEPSKEILPALPSGYADGTKYQEFNTFLEDHKTTSFLIIRNDSMLYEHYFDKRSPESINPSFSVAKSFVSALVGIAISEGKIKNVNEPITTYLPGLTSPGFDKIRIEDLLNMRSGIDFSEKYRSPFGQMPRYYYGRNLQHYLKKLKIKEPPDLHYDYISVNALLLSQILEKATGKKLSEYLSEKIWQPIGMEYPATMSVDSRKHQTIKAFCCLNARSRDFAKFGRLYLHNGNWQGKQIIPENWVKRSTSILNDSHDARGSSYTYQWRVLKDGSFYAQGILGQYIFVCPAKNIIIVRTGKNKAKVDWPGLFNTLSNKL
ncbi:MAG: serine hydrolase domain-containing protein [Bacteroidales bacterium]